MSMTRTATVDSPDHPEAFPAAGVTLLNQNTTVDTRDNTVITFAGGLTSTAALQIGSSGANYLELTATSTFGGTWDEEQDS